MGWVRAGPQGSPAFWSWPGVALAVLLVGVALAQDGHWLVGLEGASLEVRQRGGSKWASMA